MLKKAITAEDITHFVVVNKGHSTKGNPITIVELRDEYGSICAIQITSVRASLRGPYCWGFVDYYTQDRGAYDLLANPHDEVSTKWIQCATHINGDRFFIVPGNIARRDKPLDDIEVHKMTQFEIGIVYKIEECLVN